MLRKLREKAYERGLNVILDGTMASYGSTKRKIDQLHEAGYDVHAMFVDVSVDTAKRRALTRYRHALDEYTTSRARLGYGGRWLPTAVLDGQHGDDARYRTVNAATFSRLASEGVFDAEPAVFDNDVDGRRSRRLPLDGFVDGLR